MVRRDGDGGLVTLDQLETFVAVARARSFSRAAVVLDLAQPTLSGRISALERALGGPLLHRRGHTVELTDAGRELLPYAERMLTLRSEGIEALRRVQLGGLGRLALGANPTCSQVLVPRLIEAFHQRHPDVPIWVRTALTPALMENLLDGVIQLALCSRAQITGRASALWTYSDPLLLVAARHHPLARTRECERADLLDHTILSTQAGPTHIGLRHLLPAHERLRIAVEATAGEVLKHLLLRGVGISVLPAMAVWEELARGDLVSIRVRDAELPPYEVALVTWDGHSLSPAALAFAEMVGETRVPQLLDG